MAITHRVEDTRFGIPVDDAYIVFGYAFWSSSADSPKLQFSVFADEAAYIAQKSALTVIEIEAGDIIFAGIQQKAYAEIKKHPDYLDAIDA